MFLGEDKNFGFGTPTSMLYRADLVRASNAFYPNASPHADTSACFSSLRSADFGFVYQVLSYERTHRSTQSFWSAQINRYASARLNDLLEYGPLYLSSKEQQQEIKRALTDYHRFLAINWLVGSRNKDFWNYHETRLCELGYPLRRFELMKAATLSVLREILNPEQAIRKLWTRISARPRSAIVQPAISSAADRKDTNANVKSSESVRAGAR
jgi:hypothetical protein